VAWRCKAEVELGVFLELPYFTWICGRGRGRSVSSFGEGEDFSTDRGEANGASVTFRV
jgi:hypothetical protein